MALASGLVVTVMGSTAWAERAAPLVPAMTPAKPSEILVRFHDALAKGVQKAAFTTVAAATVRARLKRSVAQQACGEKSCALAAQAKLGVRLTAVAAIETVGKNYAIKVTYFRRNAAVSSASGRCDICTLFEALTATSRVATEAGVKLNSAPAPPVKKPPPTKPKPPAPTKVEPPTPASTPAAPADAKASKKRRWPLWPALVAAGVGVVGLVVGIPLVAIDGDPTNCQGDPLPDASNCQDVYSTSGGGWVMTTMGLASVAASGVLFYMYFASKGRERQRKAATIPRIAIGPAPGGAVIGAHGSF